MTERNGSSPARVAPVIGVLEWFEPGEHERVERVLAGLQTLGVVHLRTGISWAEWHREGVPEWYDWLLPRISRELQVLPCVTYTPPSLAVEHRTSAPPRRPRDYADFVDRLIHRYGGCFDELELWNEPNSRAEWDYTLDPSWIVFCEMVGAAADWARECGKRTVLGGMSPVDPGWLDLMGERGLLELFDVVGIHGFPGTWEASWDGWGPNVERVREVLDRHVSTAEVWITEAGFSTWRHNYAGQLEAFADLLEAPVRRAYWYAAEDLDGTRSAIDRFHEDEREYHFGLRRVDGTPKLLARIWGNEGAGAVDALASLGRRPRLSERHALVTGGAGFVGTNLAERLLSDGLSVCVFDNLSCPGVERNLRWLRARHGSRLRVELADIRDRFALQRALEGARSVFHLAAQAAVTTSLENPADDFTVNLEGTFRLLEELRRLDEPPPLLFTSTNKVYGSLPELALRRREDRWEPVDDRVRVRGLDESLPLSFCTPYGCSKGAADQYVLDYAKSFGLDAVVFRMSCIYGRHQHGTEDQGWVAHFLLRALARRAITLYGDGAQVRDILYVDDLVEAMLLALDGIRELGGRAFNIGGGPNNAISLLGVVDLIEALHGERPELRLEAERPGDQRYYVSDTSTFAAASGWQPTIGAQEGVELLYRWLGEGKDARAERRLKVGAG